MSISNITKFSYCYGCGVCASSCGKRIITIRLNKDGFYAPYIDTPDLCTECGICLDVCAFNHNDCALDQNDMSIKSWAAWSNDKDVRKKCSSGGIGFEIGCQLIKQGYYAVGCRYDIIEQRAEHYIASTVDEFVQSIGSKYIQSYTEDAFKQIKRNGQKYLITGTPCQIDSFRRMIRKFNCEQNFILLDFFCHCVPSMYVWNAYIKMLEPKIGKITYASWRNKFEFGWHDSWIMGIDGERTSNIVNWNNDYEQLIKEKRTYIQSRMSKGDLFYELFLGDLTLGPQCQYDCKYKMSSSAADIRIGDFWGETYSKDENGVSALVSFTERGRMIIEKLTNVTLIEHPLEVVTEGQMRYNAQRKPFSKYVMHYLKSGKSIDTIRFKILLVIIKVFSKIKHLVEV